MLGENLKQLRKQKGITQESLAIQLHVVRQTVSKWEKNLSVPDAEMLQRISEVLDTPMNTLLGADLPHEPERNEIAEQLSRLNEQLAIRNRRARRIWSIVGIVLAAILIVNVVSIVLGVVVYPSTGMTVSVSMSEEPLYDDAEVQAAIDVVQKSFKKNFKGCTLLSISYDEDYCLRVYKEMADQYGADEAIVLTSSFQTDSKGGDGSLNPNATYKDWQWVLTRTAGGAWTLQTWGY